MEYLFFPEDNLSEYQLNGTLLEHSKISPHHRARLFSWLSEECSKQRISRYSFVLTCAYIDLYCMKKNDIELRNYQLLALGALILATKQVQVEGKLPYIDFNLFKAEQLLNMERTIAYALNFYLNPPIYIELMNNIAKIWDIKCQNGQIDSKVRYFEEKKESYLRLKILYQKMDCLNLFKRVLDFDIGQVVVTLFYTQTRMFDQQLSLLQKKNQASVKTNPAEPQMSQIQNPEQQNSFQIKFSEFLVKSEINTKPNRKIQKIVNILNIKNLPINDETPNKGRTFTEFLSAQTYNKFAQQFHKKYHADFNKI